MAKRKSRRSVTHGKKKATSKKALSVRSGSRTKASVVQAVRRTPVRSRVNSHAQKDTAKPRTSQSSRKRKVEHTIRSISSGGAVKARLRRPVVSRRKPVTTNEYAAVRQALGLLRKHVHGYDSASGYSFRAISTFDKRKRDRLKARAGHLKQILSQPHDLIKPRTKKDRRALVQFTRQRLRKAKHFIVHKPGDNFRSRVRKGHVSVVGAFPGRVQSESRYFLFDRRPRHPDDVERMLKAMLPEMPKGFYVMLTGALGDTGEPIERDALLAGVRTWMTNYGSKASGESTGATEAIIGFRFMSSKLEGMEVEMRVIDHRRQSRREWNTMMDKYWKAKARGENPPLPKWTPTMRKIMKTEKIRLATQRAKRKARSKK